MKVRNLKPLKVPGIEPGVVFANSPNTYDILEQIGRIHGSFDSFKERQNERLDGIENSIADMSAKFAQAEIGRGIFGGKETNGIAPRDHEAFRALLRGDIRGAMTTDSNPDGGYLIPTTVDSQIRKLATDVGVIRQLAQTVALGQGAGSYQRIINLGGATCQWVTEKQSRTQTDGPTFGGLEFAEGEISAMPASTQRLLDDSNFDVVGEILSEVALSFAAKEDASFVSGDGVNKPRGLLSYEMVSDASWSWGKVGWTKTGVANALSDASNNGIDALIDLTHSLANEYQNGASFVMNKKTAALCRKLKDTGGQYYWQPSTQVGQPSTLLGYPVAIDPFMPDVAANSFPILFGNFRRAYVILDRIGTRILRDPYSLKPYVLFYVTRRVGGGISDFKAVKALRVQA